MPCQPVQGPWGLLSDGYRKYGEVFTVPVVNKRITFLIGPDVSPHFFKATDDEMSQTEVSRRWWWGVTSSGHQSDGKALI